MSDPAQRKDVPAAMDAGATPAVTIEQLLLAGLDHYARGQFERAVDVWTRVLFLDRNHSGAKAYIRRARAAMAERHRESEALLHAGAEACDRGEATEARELLTKAIQHGGANDEVLAVLDRAERLGGGPVAAARGGGHPRGRGQRRRPKPARNLGTRSSGPSMLASTAVVLAVAVAGLLVAWQWTPVDLTPTRSGFLSGARPTAGPPTPLPVPTVPALALGRARVLAAEGRFTEALGVLETAGSGDGLRPDVEALRGQLQRNLLEGPMTSGLGGERAPDVSPVARPAF